MRYRNGEIYMVKQTNYTEGYNTKEFGELAI